MFNIANSFIDERCGTPYGPHIPLGVGHGVGGLGQLIQTTARELGYLLKHDFGFHCGGGGVHFGPPAGCHEPPPCHGRDDWTVSNPGQGKATIDLGDDYELKLDENNSEMDLVNKHTGECTKVWGDPHMILNSGGSTEQCNFKGPLTLHLADGTDINIQTTPWNNDPSKTLASTITITKGERSIVVTGLDQNQTGDLKITQGDDGYWLDGAQPQGTQLYEGSNGQGWMDQNGGVVSQSDFDKPQTDHGGCGVNDLAKALLGIGVALIGLLSEQL